MKTFKLSPNHIGHIVTVITQKEFGPRKEETGIIFHYCNFSGGIVTVFFPKRRNYPCEEVMASQVVGISRKKILLESYENGAWKSTKSSTKLSFLKAGTIIRTNSGEWRQIVRIDEIDGVSLKLIFKGNYQEIWNRNNSCFVM
jgi:hypothetical protein